MKHVCQELQVYMEIYLFVREHTLVFSILSIPVTTHLIQSLIYNIWTLSKISKKGCFIFYHPLIQILF